MDKKKTGNLIREARTKKNYTQSELGDLIGVSNKAISRWENGDSFPDVGILESLSAVLDIRIQDIVTGNIGENDDNAVTEVVRVALLQQKEHKRILVSNGLFIAAVLCCLISGISAMESKRIFFADDSIIVYIIMMILTFVLIVAGKRPQAAIDESLQKAVCKVQTATDKTKSVSEKSQIAIDKTKSVSEKSQIAIDKTKTVADKQQNLQAMTEKPQFAIDKAQDGTEKPKTAIDKTKAVTDKQEMYRFTRLSKIISLVSVLWIIIMIWCMFLLVINGNVPFGMELASVGPFINFQLEGLFAVNLMILILQFIRFLKSDEAIHRSRQSESWVFVSISAIYLSVLYSDLLHRMNSTQGVMISLAIRTVVTLLITGIFLIKAKKNP